MALYDLGPRCLMNLISLYELASILRSSGKAFLLVPPHWFLGKGATQEGLFATCSQAVEYSTLPSGSQVSSCYPSDKG